MIRALGIALAVSVALLGISGWLLKQSYERNGELEAAARTYAKALSDKTEATKGRAVTQQKVRQMAPAEKLERLK